MSKCNGLFTFIFAVKSKLENETGSVRDAVSTSPLVPPESTTVNIEWQSTVIEDSIHNQPANKFKEHLNSARN